MKKLYTIITAALLCGATTVANALPTLPASKMIDRSQLEAIADGRQKAPAMKTPPKDLGGNFTPWETLKNGRFNNDLGMTNACDVTVYWCTTDPSGYGMGVDSWYFDGLYNGVRLAGMPFIENYQIGSGETGYTYQGKPVMYDDIKYHYSVDGVATAYDETMGLFTFGILYYVDDPDVVDNVVGFGNETVQLEGDYKDYRTSLDIIGETKDGKQLKVKPVFVDAANVKVQVYPKAYELDPLGDPGEELKAVIDAQQADAGIAPVAEAKPIYFDLSATGTYTVVMTYEGEEGAKEYNIGSYNFDSNWSDYGTADFTDDYLSSYYDEFPIITVPNVKVQKYNGKDIFRLINPWTTDDQFTKAYAKLQPVDAEINSFFVINAERPDKVYVEINPTDITYDDGVRMVAGSAAHYNIINGRTDEQITEKGYWGSIAYENNTATVTFPRMTLMMRPANTMSPLFAGFNDAFKVVITKTSDGVSDIAVDDNAPVEYYNLQGVRVENPANGLYIRRQGSKAEKVIVR